MEVSETSPGNPRPEWRGRVYVVVPAYNEATSLRRVAAELRQRYDNVVVVDDGSRDATFAEARACARFALRHAVNRGQGAAVQTGIEFALRQGAEVIVTFDADGQHRVEDIDALVRPILEGVCDITLGSRFLGRAVNLPRGRRTILRLAVLFTRVVNRMSLTDAHNGLRAFSRRAAQQIRITLDRMAHASEIIDLIRMTGLPYREVPVEVRYTEYSLAKGQSSRNAVRIAAEYLMHRFFK